MWVPLGVRLKVEQMESATRLARYNAADFQILTSLWTNDINDPNEIASLFCYYPTIQNCHSGWDDPAIDQLFLDSQQELDPAKRAAQYKEIQERSLCPRADHLRLRGSLPSGDDKEGQGFRPDPAGQQSVRRHLSVVVTHAE